MFDGGTWLTGGAALGCGLVAGVLFAFSSFVMAALARLPAAAGIAAMQAINVTVINASFMGLLFGTAALCLARGVMAGLQWQRPGAAWAMAGCAAYLVGTIGVTVVFHVPRNDALATLDPANAESAVAWTRYVQQWTAGNHVRTLAAVVAAALLVVSMLCRRDGVTP